MFETFLGKFIIPIFGCSQTSRTETPPCVTMPKHRQRHDPKAGKTRTGRDVTPMIPWPTTKFLKIILIPDPLATIIFTRLIKNKNAHLKLFKFLKQFHSSS
jgi:hypothetical protein